MFFWYMGLFHFMICWTGSFEFRFYFLNLSSGRKLHPSPQRILSLSVVHNRAQQRINQQVRQSVVSYLYYSQSKFFPIKITFSLAGKDNTYIYIYISIIKHVAQHIITLCVLYRNTLPRHSGLLRCKRQPERKPKRWKSSRHSILSVWLTFQTYQRRREMIRVS